jgi:hypothetical protein
MFTIEIQYRKCARRGNGSESVDCEAIIKKLKEQVPCIVDTEQERSLGSPFIETLILVSECNVSRENILSKVREEIEKLEENGSEVPTRMTRVTENPDDFNLRKWAKEEIRQVIMEEVGEKAISNLNVFDGNILKKEDRA